MRAKEEIQLESTVTHIGPERFRVAIQQRAAKQDQAIEFVRDAVRRFPCRFLTAVGFELFPIGFGFNRGECLLVPDKRQSTLEGSIRSQVQDPRTLIRSE